jgi:hypothetical protein
MSALPAHLMEIRVLRQSAKELKTMKKQLEEGFENIA